MSSHFPRFANALLGFMLTWQAGLAQANPSDPSITAGSASFVTPDSATLEVHNSPGTIINWRDFSIDQGELTRFIQQSSSSTVLNRVTGGNISQILGQLQSNGQVFLVNPAGVLIGPNAVIDAGGFIASTLNLSDHDFLTGNYNFAGTADTGSIINQGLIRAGSNGNILLIAPDIRNEGDIVSEGGHITLAAGQAMLMTDLDSPEIQFELQSSDDEIVNVGDISSAAGAIDLFAGAITQDGQLSASSATLDDAGNIRLQASSDTLISGSIESTAGQANGGTITLLGDRVGLLDGSLVDASGATGGGAIYIGGSQQGQGPLPNAAAIAILPEAVVRANAIENGDGGIVIAYADGFANIHGTLEARGGELGGNGGFIETSGKESFSITSIPDAGAPNGAAGEWLIDPINVSIDSAANEASDTNINSSQGIFTPTDSPSVVTVESLGTALASQNVTVKTTNDGGTEDGDIIVRTDLNFVGTPNTTLTLDAENDIRIENNALVFNNTSVDDITLVLRAIGEISVASGSEINFDPGKFVVDLEASAITFAAGATFDAGAVQSGETQNIDIPINMYGTFQLGSGGTVSFRGGGDFFDGANSGTFNLPGTLNLLSKTYDVTGASFISGGKGGSGTVTVDDGATLQYSSAAPSATGVTWVMGDASLQGGTGAGDPTVTFPTLTVQSGSSASMVGKYSISNLLVAGSLGINGEANIALVNSSGSLSLGGQVDVTTLNGNGSLTASGDVDIETLNIAKGTGSLSLSGPIGVDTLDLDGGTLNLAGANLTIFGGFTLSSGTLDLSGSTITVEGEGPIPLDVTGGTIKGNNATINGGLDLSSGSGILAPGASPGAMTIAGNLLLGPSSTTIFELAGYNSGTNLDFIQVTGNTTIDPGATAQIQLFGGFVPVTNAPFTIMNTNGTTAGSFTLASAAPFNQSLDGNTLTVTPGFIPPGASRPTSPVDVLTLTDNEGGTELNNQGAQETPDPDEEDLLLSEGDSMQQRLLLCE